MQNVYWIGGGSGAGKSTIARRIAAEYGLKHYATDDAMSEHAGRSTPKDCPLLHQFMAMDMDERWVNRSPEEMLDMFPWFRGEGFDLIVEDLLRLGRASGVVVDGFRLLPSLVGPLLSVRRHAVWLLPTPDFRQAVFDNRGWPHSGFLANTGDPGRAEGNLLERDALFTNQLQEETKRLGLKTIDVDATVTEDDLANRVIEIFGL